MEGVMEKELLMLLAKQWEAFLEAKFYPSSDGVNVGAFLYDLRAAMKEVSNG
jgi:hypothetical protein